MQSNAMRRRLLILLLWALLALGLLAAFYLFAAKGIGIPCVFYSLTGLQCPGCGNSRAALALLRLDFAAAWQYNAFFLPEFGYLFWVVLQCALSYLRSGVFRYRPRRIWPHGVMLAALLLWWIARNLL